MTDGAWEIVGQKTSNFRSAKTVGDALREIIDRRWTSGAAKHIERSWDVDPKTAKNLVQRGTVSERTLTKAVQAERWELWVALGEELFGESYEQHLQGVIDEQLRAAERAKARRDHTRRLEARASELVSLLDRSAA